MSYESPKRAIDTQTAQHIRNMQNSMLQSLNNYTNQLSDQAKQEAKERQLKLQLEMKNGIKRNKDTAKYIVDITKPLGKIIDENSYVLNPQIRDKFGKIVDIGADLKTKTTPLTPIEKTYAQNVPLLPPTFKSMLDGALAEIGEDYVKDSKNIGQPGAVSYFQPNRNNVLFADAYSGKLGPGFIKSTDIDMYNSLGPQYTLKATAIIDGKEQVGSMTSQQVRELNSAVDQEFVLRIPQPSEDMTEMAAGLGAPMNKKPNRGMITEALKNFGEAFVDEVRQTSNGTTTYSVLNKPVAEMYYRALAKKNIKVMTRNQKIALYNYYMQLGLSEEQKVNEVQYTGFEEPLNEEQLKFTEDMYAEVALNSYTSTAEIKVGQTKNFTLAQQKEYKERQDNKATVQGAADILFDGNAKEISDSFLFLGNKSEFRSVEPVMEGGLNDSFGTFSGVISVTDTKSTSIDGESRPITVIYDLKNDQKRRAFAKRMYPVKKEAIEFLKILDKKYNSKQKDAPLASEFTYDAINNTMIKNT